jgi:hypothetical protein
MCKVLRPVTRFLIAELQAIERCVHADQGRRLSGDGYFDGINGHASEDLPTGLTVGGPFKAPALEGIKQQHKKQLNPTGAAQQELSTVGPAQPNPALGVAGSTDLAVSRALELQSAAHASLPGASADIQAADRLAIGEGRHAAMQEEGMQTDQPESNKLPFAKFISGQDAMNGRGALGVEQPPETEDLGLKAEKKSTVMVRDVSSDSEGSLPSIDSGTGNDSDSEE